MSWELLFLINSIYYFPEVSRWVSIDQVTRLNNHWLWGFSSGIFSANSIFSPHPSHPVNIYGYSSSLCLLDLLRYTLHLCSVFPDNMCLIDTMQSQFLCSLRFRAEHMKLGTLLSPLEWKWSAAFPYRLYLLSHKRKRGS